MMICPYGGFCVFLSQGGGAGALWGERAVFGCSRGRPMQTGILGRRKDREMNTMLLLALAMVAGLLAGPRERM